MRIRGNTRKDDDVTGATKCVVVVVVTAKRHRVLSTVLLEEYCYKKSPMIVGWHHFAGIISISVYVRHATQPEN